MISRLALFDIDGTLLHTNGCAVAAMMEALKDVYGARPAHDGFLMDGKTELCIVQELLGEQGIDRARIRAALPEFWRRYEAALEAHVTPARTEVYRGVHELLERLAEHPEVGVGLITGNFPAGAWIKLRAAGLDGAFAFGAFGEQHEDRTALPALALEAARERLGVTLGGEAAVVLGDTPNDIRCARTLGMRTVAVATGRYDAPSLAAHRPDHLFPDFTDAGAVVDAILTP